MLADVTFSTEGIVIIGVLLAALVTAIGILHKLTIASWEGRIADKDKQLELERSKNKSYNEIADEAVRALKTLNDINGKTYVRSLAPVVPEANSPPTQEAIKTAELQTLRAQLTAETLRAELPPRQVGTGSTPVTKDLARELFVQQARSEKQQTDSVLKQDIAEVKAKVETVDGKVEGVKGTVEDIKTAVTEDSGKG